jgi:ankyrin repeat protein
MLSRFLLRATRVVAAGIALAALAGCVHLPDKPAYTKADPATLRQYDGDWFDAARVGRVDILQALLDAGYPIDTADSHGYTAVILSAYDGQPAALDFLLSAGANACVGDRHGNTALMGTLFKGESAIARRLIDTRCPIDQTNGAGETALGFATLFNRIDMIPVLVKHGADPNHVDGRGQSLLQIALTHDSVDAASALREASATR